MTVGNLMSQVSHNSDYSQQTLSNEGVAVQLAGTPLEPYAATIVKLARDYEVDVNWAMSYLRWESGFGASQIGRQNPTNPWDILCYSGQWGQVDEFRPGNGYCYAVYPDVPTGLEAGFRQWRRYRDVWGATTWRESLCIAVSGNVDSCNEQWVNNVVASAQHWASLYPFDGINEQQLPEPVLLPPQGPSGPSQGPQQAPVGGQDFPLQALLVPLGLGLVVVFGLSLAENTKR